MSLARSCTLAELGIDPEPARPPTRQGELRAGLEWLAGSRGIKVVYYPFCSFRTAGLFVQEDGGGYCRAVNSRMSPTRQLFDLAHELGRYWLHRHR